MPSRKLIKIDQCHICGEHSQLTEEHVPPKNAYNKGRYRLADAKSLLEATSLEQYLNAPYRIEQGGSKYLTLCGRCNSSTGGWYGKSYITWARQVAEATLNNPESKFITATYYIQPLEVMKQIVAMFASACAPGLFDTETYLRKFVLDQNCKDLPPHIKIYASSTGPSPDVSRQSGLTGVLDASNPAGDFKHYAEINHFPLGYIMTIKGGKPDPDLVDISSFAISARNQSTAVTMTLPVKKIYSPLPGVFSTKEEIHRSLEKRK